MIFIIPSLLILLPLPLLFPFPLSLSLLIFLPLFLLLSLSILIPLLRFIPPLLPSPFLLLVLFDGLAGVGIGRIFGLSFAVFISIISIPVAFPVIFNILISIGLSISIVFIPLPQLPLSHIRLVILLFPPILLLSLWSWAMLAFLLQLFLVLAIDLLKRGRVLLLGLCWLITLLPLRYFLLL